MIERPSRRVVLAVVVVSISVVTGCLGAGPGTPATTTPNTDCPPALTVTEMPAEQVDTESAVADANLTAEQRATFDRARNGSVEDFAYAWRDIDLVEYDGGYYNTGILVC